MTRITEIDLTTSGSALWLVLFVLVGIAFSYFVYRRTVPPVSAALRYLLMGLRAAAVVLVLLLLFEPILSVTRQKQKRPVVAVLVDRSASMSLVDRQTDRAAELRRVLQDDLFRDPPNDIGLEFYPFSYRLFAPLEGPPDSVASQDDGTDIGRALEELREAMAEKYFAGVILLSDGANNLGENPARLAARYGVPIFPVAIGDSAQQKDVLITNYVTNEIGYAGSKIPVDVYLKSSGFANRRIPVNLVQGNRTLDSKVITLSGNELEQKVRLHFTPEQEGVLKYEIKLPTLEGELTTANNAKAFYVRVLKSRLQILLVAGGPSPDLPFLKRTLAADENLDVTAYVEKLRGRFYQAPTLPPVDQLARFDCVILLDFPRRTSSQNALNQLKALLARGKPMLHLLSKNVDYDKLLQLRDFLPLGAKPVKGPERLVYLEILPQGLNHPILRLSEDEIENREKWRELPPVFTDLLLVNVHPNGQSLAAVDVARSGRGPRRPLPLILTRTTGQRKSVAVLAYGLWRWNFLMWGVGKTDESYRRFLRNTVRWLTTQEDSKLVRVTSNKEIYRSGEEVKFVAQVYYEDYQPVDGAEVVVQLRGGKEPQELTLTNIGEGRYEGRFEVLEGGDYEFTGTAHQQGRVLGRDSGRFSVEAFSLEYQNTRANVELLRRLAEASGGAFFTSADFSGLSDRLSFPEKYITLNNEWEVWNKTPLLIAALLLLSTEWFIRKRKGML